MANLTVTIDEAVLRRARARAQEQGTSVNAIVNDYLTHFAGDDATAQALTAFLEIAATIEASSGPEGRTWTRDDLYDRPNVR